jgi:hypothetical protein
LDPTPAGHLRKTWKRRWFVLKGTTLTYHKSEQDKLARGKIKLKGARAHVATRHTDTTYGGTTRKPARRARSHTDLYVRGQCKSAW